MKSLLLDDTTLYTQELDNNLILAEKLGDNFYKSVVICNGKILKPKVVDNKLVIDKPKGDTIRLMITKRGKKSSLFISELIDNDWVTVYSSTGFKETIDEHILKARMYNSTPVDLNYYRSKYQQEVKWLMNNDLCPKDYPGLSKTNKVNLESWR